MRPVFFCILRSLLFPRPSVVIPFTRHDMIYNPFANLLLSATRAVFVRNVFAGVAFSHAPPTPKTPTYTRSRYPPFACTRIVYVRVISRSVRVCVGGGSCHQLFIASASASSSFIIKIKKKKNSIIRLNNARVHYFYSRIEPPERNGNQNNNMFTYTCVCVWVRKM